ncbi:hypothetical protein EC968_003585 [Mortierella alpina]|nr:hypothetical protein EC968_003585 [Mortierella alpina]
MSGAKRSKPDDINAMLDRLESFRDMDFERRDFLHRWEESLAKRETALAEDKAFVRSQLESIDRQRLKERGCLDRERDTIGSAWQRLDKWRNELYKERMELDEKTEKRHEQLEERRERLATDNSALKVQLLQLKHELDLVRRQGSS